MNKLAVQRQSRPLLPELSQLFTGLPAFAGFRPFFDTHPMRLEDETKDGIFEVRAELPGVDPIEDDISATYDRGILTVAVPLSDTTPTEKHVNVFEIAPLDEDDEDDDLEGEDDGLEGEDQHRSDDGA